MGVEALDRFVQQVVSQVRWRRAEHYGLRGAFYGALGAVVVLIFKETLGAWTLPTAAGAFVLGTVIGMVVGLAKKVPVADAARLADRAFGLDERVATSIEWANRPDRSPLVAALVADASERVATLPAAADHRSSFVTRGQARRHTPSREPGARAGPGCSRALLAAARLRVDARAGQGS